VEQLHPAEHGFSLDAADAQVGGLQEGGDPGPQRGVVA